MEDVRECEVAVDFEALEDEVVVSFALPVSSPALFKKKVVLSVQHVGSLSQQ